MFDLTGQPVPWISTSSYFGVGHDLNSLRFGYREIKQTRIHGDRAIHKSTFSVVVVEQSTFERFDARGLYWPRPDVRDLPYSYLAVRDNIASCTRQMPHNSRSDPVNGLSDVNWDFVQVT